VRFKLGQAGFELRHARLERFLLLARLLRHGVHGLVLLARDEVHLPYDAFHQLAHARLRLAAQAARHAGGAAGDARQIGQHAALTLHARLPYTSGTVTGGP